MPRQRLVDSVVHHLEYHVVQSAAVVGIADVHSGPLSNRV
jgi:transposase